MNTIWFLAKKFLQS